MLAPTPSALSLRLQGFRSAADKPAQQRVDSAAQRGAMASAIHIAVAAEPYDVQRGDGLRSFSARNDKDPLLISPRAARRLCDIQAHTLGSSQSLIAQLQIRDRSVLHHHKQFASDLIRSQGFVWKSRPVRHRRPPSKNGAAGEADDDERTTVEAQRERSELRIVILIEILASPVTTPKALARGLAPNPNRNRKRVLLKSVWVPVLVLVLVLVLASHFFAGIERIDHQA